MAWCLHRVIGLAHNNLTGSLPDMFNALNELVEVDVRFNPLLTGTRDAPHAFNPRAHTRARDHAH
jgi:hypothetical protein